MITHSNIFAMKAPWTVWKGKNIWHWKMSPPSWEVSNMLLGKSRGQLLTAPERMKQLGQSGNDTQLWMCLLVKVKSNAVKNDIASDQISRSVVSNSLQPHESQNTRPPCPSPPPGVHSDSRPSSQWCHPAISSSVVPFSSCPQFLPASVFSNESTLCMRWPKYWSFSFSIIPSKEIP